MVWALVLGPSLLRRRFERRSGDSIGTFHRQLRILGRAGPTLVNPAYRLRTEVPRSSVDVSDAPLRQIPRWDTGDNDRRSDLMVVRPDARPPMAPPSGARASGPHTDPYFRPGAAKRRRDVLMILGCGVVLTGLLGAVPALRMLLIGTGVVAAALAVYLVLLVTLRRRALEREAKLRYLPRPAAPALSIPERRVAAR